ncbi:endonuclease domain-containing protein [Nocardioidaceae bacterium]|nr:endonuclease domain-containing protein [Nocardioidaceae bacterium]
MHPTETLRRLGGVADWSTLVRSCPDHDIRRLVQSGDIVRLARGRFALPEVASALTVSHALSGTLSVRSAALHHGWEVARVPVRPDVTVRRKRHLTDGQKRQATFRYVDLRPEEICDGVTTPERTMADCLQHLPAEEALSIADSGLRLHAFTPSSLVRLADGLTGRGRRQAAHIASLADGRAANPFESVLRHLAGQVGGLEVVPQTNLHDERGNFLARPDLVDPRLRLVLEADSFAWHGSRRGLRRDCRRYTALVVHGWLVLRFTWEDVMHRPEYVLSVLRQAVATASTRADAHGA